jgi:hypothetical protein
MYCAGMGPATTRDHRWPRPSRGGTAEIRSAGASFDHVITLCDRVTEVCPSFDGPRRAHWSIPDFDHVADQLTERIGFFLHTLAEES